jgi:cobyrinic acid a,c-diamide synthase
VQRALPRVVVAGLAGDSGKTLLSLGLISALRSRGLRVAPFKKGPDFIDSAWAGAAAGVPGRNLDSFLMAEEAILGSVGRAAPSSDIAVIEGNRGLFDGMDAEGTHSTARLAMLLKAPVVLVVEATKTTRTVAALVKGCQALDPDLWISGVVVNRVGTGRQEALIRQAVKADTGLEVIGAIPRLPDRLPSRHLGLVTAIEHPAAQETLQNVARAVEKYVDVSAVINLAARAPALAEVRPMESKCRTEETRVKIGVLQDKAFSFYYPENLEALQEHGAQLVPISPLVDDELPAIEALYAGGGFPEVYAEQLSANEGLKKAIRERIAQGLPVWAECGGLMYLSESLAVKSSVHPMVGALPVTVEQTSRPQGHGYVQAVVDAANPFLEPGAQLRGHEFHYSRIRDQGRQLSTVLSLKRGTGVGGKRDGIVAGSVLAMYTHVHALGFPCWAASIVRAASGGHPRCALKKAKTETVRQHEAMSDW